ncbi:MAG: hypothetical protein KAT58_11005 [candidate division Zixibacteria bacterium]|nr:hypothetical protein [candidate division Zixibacteria bacterium]
MSRKTTAKIKIKGDDFEVIDFGPNKVAAFRELFERVVTDKPLESTDFEVRAFELFDSCRERWGKHDDFFASLGTIWYYLMERGSYRRADQLWQFSFELVREWELQRDSNRVHKGALYYYWAVTRIIMGDLEAGFLFMHQALEEDYVTHAGDVSKSPALAFVRLDYDNENQFFREKVDEIRAFLSNRIGAYNISRDGDLGLDEFKRKFLLAKDMRDVVFFFVYQCFRLKALADQDSYALEQNLFGSLMFANAAFCMCLVLDSVVARINPNKERPVFSVQMGFLLRSSGISLSNDDIGEINGSFRNDGFSTTLRKILQSDYILKNGRSLTAIEGDLAVCYGFRNHGAHKIKAQPVIYQHFDEILQRLFNSIFFAVEVLY